MRGIAWIICSGVVVSLDVGWIDGSAGDWFVHKMRRVHLRCTYGRMYSLQARDIRLAPQNLAVK